MLNGERAEWVVDDPYYYLTQNLIPSYWALETEVFPEGGHVIRFDSFSKLLAAGMRLVRPI